MNHNDAVSLFGRCRCSCHAAGVQPCWCRDVRVADPFEISHNDRVRHLGGCQCRGRVCRWRTTAPDIARALQRREDAARDDRIRTGRLRGSDVTHVARHPQRYPHLFG